MSTLKKGDLVMTEHGLAIFRKFTHLIGYRCYVLTLGTTIACEFALLLSSEHRPQVEQYLKEKGWAHKEARYFFKQAEGYICYCRRYDNVWYVEFFENEQSLEPSQFDTAPEQLAEAILMARLLNATKP